MGNLESGWLRVRWPSTMGRPIIHLSAHRSISQPSSVIGSFPDITVHNHESPFTMGVGSGTEYPRHLAVRWPSMAWPPPVPWPRHHQYDCLTTTQIQSRVSGQGLTTEVQAGQALV